MASIDGDTGKIIGKPYGQWANKRPVSRVGNPGKGVKRHSGLSMDDAKQQALKARREGRTVEQAMASVNRTAKTWERWRNQDPLFKQAGDAIRSAKTNGIGGSTDTEYGTKAEMAKAKGFAWFRREYLDRETPWHAQQWVDVLEGREPSNLHPAQQYIKGSKKRLLVNCPPHHGKTATVTQDWILYRICCNASIRIRLISGRAEMAKQSMFQVKEYLTHPKYSRLQEDFGPEGGYESTAKRWGADTIYLAREEAEPNPTLQCIGLGGQLYGARCDVIIADDIAYQANANEFKKQFRIITIDAASRLGPAGILAIVGTRVAETDVYSELLNPDNFQFGTSPFTLITQPAILKMDADPTQVETLWPWSRASWCANGEECPCGTDECREGVEDENGDVWYPRWDSAHLRFLQEGYDARTWELIFQQVSIASDSTFPEHAMRAATNFQRSPGQMRYLDREDYAGMHLIASLDPATSGAAGSILLAVDRKTGKRYVVDVKVLKSPGSRGLKEHIQNWTEKYRPNEWVIEKTGLNTYFTQDEELLTWLTMRGIPLHQHETGKNKWDAGFGIGSMSALFGTYAPQDDGSFKQISAPVISLPRWDVGTSMGEFIHQMRVWTPELDPKRIACDTVMALWFAEIRAREIVRQISGVDHFRPSKWLSKHDQNRQNVIDLQELFNQKGRAFA